MANKALPVYERQTTVQETSVPDIQGAYQKYAESTNLMSDIGAQVAQSASQARAKQLGYEMGQNPQGDLGPSLTEFDKTLAESYHAQAANTLGLQFQKLSDDSQLAMSKATRLTPELIANNNQEMMQGIEGILKNAPIAIKGKLEANLKAQLMSDNTKYEGRMYTEQREDTKNQYVASVKLYTDQAYDLAFNGNHAAAEDTVKTAEMVFKNGDALKYFTPEEAYSSLEGVKQAKINGIVAAAASRSMINGEYPQFAKRWAEQRPDKIDGIPITQKQYESATQSILSHAQFIQTLKSQEENLQSQRMVNDIATNVNAITGAQLEAFKASVSPIQYEQVKFKYIQALKARQSESLAEDTLIQNYSDPRAHANADPKVRDATFNRLVDNQIDKSKNTSTPMNRDMAEVLVAADAGGEVPVFTRTLKSKLRSGNPAMIDSAGQQIHTLLERENGNALSGLNDKDHAMIGMFDTLKSSMNPSEAAREATNVVYNKDTTTMEANDRKWKNAVYSIVKTGTNTDKWAIENSGLNYDNFLNPSQANAYGSVLFKKYESFFKLSNGDEALAQKLTQDYAKQVFGDTKINGGEHTTLHPIEKALGFKSDDGIPYIQEDFRNQFNERLELFKKDHGAHAPGESWEVVPPTGKTHGVFSTTYDPIKLKYTNTVTKKKETYDVVLNGNSYDGWDISVNANGFIRPIMQVAPYLGIQVFVPNRKAIIDKWNKDHNLH